MAVTIFCAVMIALSPAGTGGQLPPVWGGGGPDSFGYRYLDSDTTCPGAPVYNWIEIKGVGTRVTGLGDDNVVGPFDIGFDFPYYWYRVNKVYIGSNGYIAFHDNALNASPFQRIPSPTRSNNTLAVLMSDIDCSASGSPNGSVWVWTSPNNDTFIVEYDSVRFWNTGGNNTFQIILSKPDSSITFQYKEQSGAPYNGWVPDANQCGIENVSGRIGLNYLSGNIPPGNMYHPGLAVRFFPPESTTLQVHDAAVRNAMNDRSGGMFAVNGQPITFWGVIQNTGNQAEPQFRAVARVRNQAGSVVFIDSTNVQALNPSETDSVVFTRTWTPSSNGVYTIQVISKLPGDAVPVNDTVTIELRVVTLPTTLTYDRGTPTNSMYWNGPGGFGNRFVPPVYPCSISSARVYMQATTSTPVAIGIYDDNGPGGSPGDTLYIATVNVLNADWYTINPPNPIVITDGAFFVGATSEVTGSPSFGMDSVPPLSYQGWEYTGVWAPSRDASMRDIMANATVSGRVGVMELTPEPVRMPARLEVTPNPGNGLLQLTLSERSGAQVEVYDATGKLVSTVTLKDGTGRLDVRNLAGGIYFARVVNNGSSVAKVIVSR
ncbi:MAG: T9SS type A sorting domain-containing protein [candidate division WOR-3 bacterium]